MIKKILIFLTILVQIYFADIWLKCVSFSDVFRFSFFDVNLKLVENIDNDRGFSPTVVRFFHNKLQLSIDQLIKHYIQFWDIKFGSMFFSLVGYFGIMCGFYYLIATKNKYKWYIFAILLLLPLFEVFHLIKNYRVELLIFTIPYQLFSLFGLWCFLKKYKRTGYITVSILIVLSFWLIPVFGKDFLQFCIKR